MKIHSKVIAIFLVPLWCICCASPSIYMERTIGLNPVIGDAPRIFVSPCHKFYSKLYSNVGDRERGLVLFSVGLGDDDQFRGEISWTDDFFPDKVFLVNIHGKLYSILYRHTYLPEFDSNAMIRLYRDVELIKEFSVSDFFESNSEEGSWGKFMYENPFHEVIGLKKIISTLPKFDAEAYERVFEIRLRNDAYFSFRVKDGQLLNVKDMPKRTEGNED